MGSRPMIESIIYPPWIYLFIEWYISLILLPILGSSASKRCHGISFTFLFLFKRQIWKKIKFNYNESKVYNRNELASRTAKNIHNSRFHYSMYWVSLVLKYWVLTPDRKETQLFWLWWLCVTYYTQLSKESITFCWLILPEVHYWHPAWWLHVKKD